MKLIIHVKQKHIDQGVVGDVLLCPLARAIAEALPGRRVSVCLTSGYADWKNFSLPPSAVEFRRTFDHARWFRSWRIRPFAFELEVQET